MKAGGGVHVSTVPAETGREHQTSLELEFQMDVNCLVWVMRIKPDPWQEQQVLLLLIAKLSPNPLR